jgi:non-canonical (house-cleaning) NTP pyrophosphatase
MPRIIVAVGSIRRPKLNAVTEALQALVPIFAAPTEFEVLGVEVDSGVGHTPSSRNELMLGARRRAEAVARLAREQNQPWRYFVGLEGGLDVVHEDPASGQVAQRHDEGAAESQLAFEIARRVFLESWAYVTDGVRGHFGRSGGVEIPELLAREVLDNGVELSLAIDRFAVTHDPDRFAGTSGIRNAQGAWGVLSGNLITRQEAFRVAVIAAFAPFYNAEMYGANEHDSAGRREPGQFRAAP